MRFLISLSDQILGALLTFIVNLWMAREGGPDAYGVYALWLAVAWISGAAQSTLVTSHLAGLNASDQEERETAERFFLTIHILFVFAAAAITAGASAILLHRNSPFHASSAVFFVPFFLIYQYTRALFFAHHRPDCATALTASTLFLFIGMASVCSFYGYAPTPDIGLALAGTSYGIVALIWLVGFTKGRRPLVQWQAIRPHLHYLRSSGWILLGAGSSELTNRLFSFVTAGRYGANSLAMLSATQVAIRPAWMLSAAWSSVSQPQLARLWRDHNHRRFLAVLGAGLLFPLLGSLLWTGGVELGWPEISRLLYKGRYERNGHLILLWGCNVVLGGLSAVGGTAMLAMKRYRSLAITDVLAALTTCACMAALSRNADYSLVIVGTLAGQAVQCLSMALYLKGALHDTSHAEQASPPSSTSENGAPQSGLISVRPTTQR
ncbi:hypothetical protein HLH26_02380 [Gluconacetobacter sp. 1b LMG 1731]|uniref:Polysaccharide biosynthesis protein n=1 Tax=Gluconacetobacter dulcium TaxID=2729096 RepID=A0A7W4NUI2_9PROT|nr:hypothetical protein [Gluconacetobacter dulcium]MBB2163395.1 hypothetical protein [Gluconacetobacter dulcium]MBB2192488.1 hypothetical protein [Gluconacetobacter dulcium]